MQTVEMENICLC